MSTTKKVLIGLGCVAVVVGIAVFSHLDFERRCAEDLAERFRSINENGGAQSLYDKLTPWDTTISTTR